MLLHDKLGKYNLILASSSPRRRHLLRDAGLTFGVAPYFETDESFPEGMPAGEVALYLSRKKSECYPFDIKEEDIVITADTTVVADGNVLGKPVSVEHAADMLRLLSGKWHTVITGVTIRTCCEVRSFSSSTRVKFKELTDEEIAYYVENYSPMDKAGSYGIQEWIGYIGIESVDGSYYNVVGLPIQRLCAELDSMIDERGCMRCVAVI